MQARSAIVRARRSLREILQDVASQNASHTQYPQLERGSGGGGEGGDGDGARVRVGGDEDGEGGGEGGGREEEEEEAGDEDSEGVSVSGIFCSACGQDVAENENGEATDDILLCDMKVRVRGWGRGCVLPVYIQILSVTRSAWPSCPIVPLPHLSLRTHSPRLCTDPSRIYS